jgi:RNA polymerase sigma-70 factor (ECF subfamily)
LAPERPPPAPAFEDLYREFLPRIYGFVRSQVSSSAEAEDVTSQVFFNAYRAYARFDPRGGSPSAWLFTIARNAIADFHRGGRRADRLVRAASREPATPDPADLAERHLEQRRLLALLSRLSERQREVIGLRHSGLSFAEVGEQMKCSQDAAKMLYHRALRALRSLAGE